LSARAFPGAALGAAIAAVIALAGAGVFVWSERRSEAPPVLAQLPDFSLTDAAGRAVTRATFAGRPFVADFIFTRCPASCPLLTAAMKRLAEEISPAGGARDGALAPRLRFLSVSVDPEFDRPPVLAAYARARGAARPDWIFATGAREEIYSLVRRGFLLPVEPGAAGEGGIVLHSTRFALVDGRGRLRGTYDALERDGLAKLRADLAAVLREES